MKAYDNHLGYKGYKVDITIEMITHNCPVVTMVCEDLDLTVKSSSTAITKECKVEYLWDEITEDIDDYLESCDKMDEVVEGLQ